MNLRFTKMHGLGNDFMVIDGINQKINLKREDIIAWANRHTGIGFDQCLIVEPSLQKSVDFFYRIFNADGEEVGQCGNGARCLARFVNFYKLSAKKQLVIMTKTTQMTLQLNEKDVTVQFARPQLAPLLIPMQASKQAIFYNLPMQNGSSLDIHAISVGNPHAIAIVSNLSTIPVPVIGKEISEHHLFPEQINASFMEILSPSHIRLRVYERGCGETNACGSAAVAAAAIGRLYYHLHSSLRVSLRGGELEVEWPDMSGPIFLTGPATFVYEGILTSAP